ncbi:hypothetical protein Bca4012_073744 [Brassica carinata]
MAKPPAAAAATGDPRCRLSASIEAICERRFRRNNQSGGRSDMVKPFNILNFPTQEKNSSCCCSMFQIVKVLLCILLSATLFTIIYSSEAYHHFLSHSSRRSDSFRTITDRLKFQRQSRLIAVTLFTVAATLFKLTPSSGIV